MDVVLEVADTFLFDRFYANVLPLQQSVGPFNPASTLASTLQGVVDLNASFAYLSSYLSDAPAVKSQWSYQPSTSLLNLEPTAYAYQSQWDRDNVFRQTLSLYVLTCLMGASIYFIFATLSYIFVFDKTTFQHPKYLKNQMRMEIHQALTSIPVIATMTVPVFVAEVRGHSYMFDDINNLGFNSPLINLLGGWYTYLQFPLFLMFTDFLIYWIHRGLHHPILYKHLHKPHHKWIMPTPYASIAFHPLDGYAQSVPYHLFPFVFPLNKFAYIALFAFIQIWTVMIHDGEYVANSPIINGAACHTMHHLYFNYNYGQFTTLWDRLGGSYRKPNDELFAKETKMSEAEWSRQTKEMEKVVKEVEGQDDRTYGPPDTVAKKTQ